MGQTKKPDEELLLPYFQIDGLEAGCDEAGRGCLAGPVFAAAVILPKTFSNPFLRDSKKLSLARRLELRERILEEAVCCGVGYLSPEEIDQHNILRASFLAMHRALEQLSPQPNSLLIDGNRFIPYRDLPHHCMVKGDDRFYSVAAASVLAKTYRDEEMQRLHELFPMYGWASNKGYPSRDHREALRKHGPSPHHRRSFRLLPAGEQITFPGFK